MNNRDRTAYVIYGVAAAAAALFIIAIFYRVTVDQINNLDPAQGRIFDMYKGVANPDYWPDNLGEKDFFLNPQASFLTLGPVAAIYIGELVFLVTGLNGTALSLANSLCMIINFIGLIFIFRSCAKTSVKPAYALIISLILMLNPFFHMKLSTDPSMGFGMLTVPWAYYAMMKGRHSLWAVLVAVIAFYHPFGIFTASLWFAYEYLTAEDGLKKAARAGLAFMAAVAIYRACTMGVELLFFKDRSWMYDAFGNGSYGIIPLIMGAQWATLKMRLIHGVFAVILMSSTTFFFRTISRKYLIIVMMEVLFVFVGSDGVENGCSSVFAGLFAVGMIDRLAGLKENAPPAAERSLRRALLLSLLFCVGLNVAYGFGQLTYNPSFLFYHFRNEPKADPARKALVIEAASMIEGAGATCVTNMPLTPLVSSFCDNTASIYSYYPYDLAEMKTSERNSLFKADYMLLDREMLETAYKSVSVKRDDIESIKNKLNTKIKNENPKVLFEKEGILLLDFR